MAFVLAHAPCEDSYMREALRNWGGAGRIPRLPARVGLAIRRHWLFTILFSAGLALRIATQAAYRPALVYIDSYRYLSSLSSQDPLGYRVLLWPLNYIGGLASVAAFQHVLGLAMAVALYAVLLRQGMWRWAAALAATPVLLDAYQLQLEQTIMPDVMFEALIVAALTVLLWCGQLSSSRLGAACMLLGASVDVRQVGEVLIIAALVFALVRPVAWRQRLAHSVVIVAVFALPVLAYMAAQFVLNGHFAITQRNGYIFYGRAAAAADCTTLRLPADERALCPPQRVVDALGIDGLVGDPTGPLLSYRPPPGITTEAMANRFERAVFMQQPLAVAESIDRDILKLFAVTRDQVPGDTPIRRWQFQDSYPTYPPLITLRYVARRSPGDGLPTVNRPLASLLRLTSSMVGILPGRCSRSPQSRAWLASAASAAHAAGTQRWRARACS